MPEKEKLYLVSYDISDTKTRNKIADTLKNFGQRVQYSVFECRLNEKRWKSMYGQLVKMPLEADDSIRLYPLCENCAVKIRIIGTPGRPNHPSNLIIV